MSNEISHIDQKIYRAKRDALIYMFVTIILFLACALLLFLLTENKKDLEKANETLVFQNDSLERLNDTLVNLKEELDTLSNKYFAILEARSQNENQITFTTQAETWLAGLTDPNTKRRRASREELIKLYNSYPELTPEFLLKNFVPQNHANAYRINYGILYVLSRLPADWKGSAKDCQEIEKVGAYVAENSYQDYAQGALDNCAK